MFKEDQRGRSIMEILMVLSIIGILSVVMIDGYHVAQKRHQANDLIHTEQLLAIETLSATTMGQTALSFSLQSPFNYSVDLLTGQAFRINFTDIDQEVCQAVLNKIGQKIKLKVNDTLYTGENHICALNNTLQFYHNTLPQGESACEQAPVSHCQQWGYESEECVCQKCEAGYDLSENKICVETECPPHSSLDGTEEDTDVSGCKCLTDTPEWDPNDRECKSRVCATQMLTALVNAGMGPKETLEKNFDSLLGHSIHYTGNMEFKEDLDLSDCSLDIDGYFYAEEATIKLAALTTKTNESSKIALNLFRAKLEVSGDIIAQAYNNQALKLAGNKTEATASHLSAHNITATSTNANLCFYNEDWGNLQASGTLSVQCNQGKGIENYGDITAGTINVNSKGLGFKSTYGVITVSNDINVASQIDEGITFGQGSTLNASGNIIGISQADKNGLNINGTASAAQFYYCPKGFVKNKQIQCSPDCTEGVCQCPKQDFCLTMGYENNTCICQKCAEGYALSDDNKCIEIPCPNDSSKNGSGDETNVFGCRCNTGTEQWTGTTCVAKTCATQMLKALVNAGMGQWDDLKGNFASMTGDSVHYTGNMEFKEDLDLSDCSLDIDGYFYAENATVKLKSLAATTTENTKIGINLYKAHLKVSGDIQGNSATLYGIKIDENSSMTAEGSITGRSKSNTNGINNGKTMTAPKIYYCPTHWGKSYSTQPIRLSDCTF